MRKYFLYILLLLIPVMNTSGSGMRVPVMEDQPDLFTALNLSQKGLTSAVFQLALKGYKKLETIGKLRNSGILTIVDLSQSSKNKRFYVIDLLHKVLLFNTYVAHGRNTGDEYAKHFSNKPGSCQSSLGFYVTKEENAGASVGLSLILEGVEKGFNDNALKREIIIHGAKYATEDFIRKTGRLGRSFGCPSLPPDLLKAVVEAIKEGTCLFIYHQDDQYLNKSTLLN
ncbi:MAG: murein L,D-transpeptidase catalytic domain family protein [Bacteroidetes bacterium]|nr:murein L,D-transpeptidase catalytic domain family protein [Bacteroidota bacterium]